MALSPARRHFLRMTSAIESSLAQAGSGQTGDQYELMAAALWEARRELKGLQARAAKAERKTKLLTQFLPYIDGVIASGNGAQDDVLMTCMVWLLDTGDFARAAAIAAYALKHNIKTPDQYQRATAPLIAEEIAEEALRRLNSDDVAGNEVALLEHLEMVEQLTSSHDMHDQIRAKLHKAIGYTKRALGFSEGAIESLNKALQLNDKVGVKKDIEKLQRDLANNKQGKSDSGNQGKS